MNESCSIYFIPIDGWEKELVFSNGMKGMKSRTNQCSLIEMVKARGKELLAHLRCLLIEITVEIIEAPPQS